MEKRLEEEFNMALANSANAHATNINHDYLPIFKRVAKESPERITTVVKLYKSHITIHRSNLVAALFGLIELADINQETKRIISENFPSTEIDYYINDADEDVAGNATILKAVLQGTPLSNFQKKQISQTPINVHIGDKVTGDKISDNNFGDNNQIFIKSQNSSIFIRKINQLTEEIENHYQGNDKEELKKIINEIIKLSESDKNKSGIISLLGGFLTRTAEVSTIAPIVIEIMKMLV